MRPDGISRHEHDQADMRALREQIQQLTHRVHDLEQQLADRDHRIAAALAAAAAAGHFDPAR
jgi:phage shock protein A